MYTYILVSKIVLPQVSMVDAIRGLIDGIRMIHNISNYDTSEMITSLCVKVRMAVTKWTQNDLKIVHFYSPKVLVDSW